LDDGLDWITAFEASTSKFFFFISFLSHTKKLIVQVVRSRPHVFLMKSFCFVCILATFFLDLKKKKIHHSIFVVVVVFPIAGHQ